MSGEPDEPDVPGTGRGAGGAGKLNPKHHSHGVFFVFFGGTRPEFETSSELGIAEGICSIHSCSGDPQLSKERTPR